MTAYGFATEVLGWGDKRKTFTNHLQMFMILVQNVGVGVLPLEAEPAIGTDLRCLFDKRMLAGLGAKLATVR